MVVWPNLTDITACGLSVPDLEYARAELSREPGYYEARVRRAGLHGHRIVLDAGCGIGQWSVVMATGNTAVIGLDPSLERLRAARLIAQRNGVGNVHFVCASAEALPFRPGRFNAALCYGVLMFVRPRRTLRELATSLASGGRLYLIVSGPGWYVFRFPWRSWAQRSPWPLVWSVAYLIRTGWRVVTSRDIRYTCFTKPDLRRLLRRVGLRPEAIGPEGTLGCGPTEPAYRSGPFGLAIVHEVLASKPSEP